MENLWKANYSIIRNAAVPVISLIMICCVLLLSIMAPNFTKGVLTSFRLQNLDDEQRSNNLAKLLWNQGDSAHLQVGVAVSALPNDKLDKVLEKSTKYSDRNNNKTVIIAMINNAYVESGNETIMVNMLDLFLESFWLGENTRPLINRLIIVTIDQRSYERCLFRGLHCYLMSRAASETTTMNGDTKNSEKVYMSKGFINMMWRRTSFLLEVLKRGYNFIFTDTDVMWLRDPFTRLNSSSTYDIQFSTDRYNGYPRSIANPINTGFYFVRSNNKTIELFKRWYAMKDNSTGLKEQDVLQKMIHDGVLSQLGIRSAFLETRYFSGFCQGSKDLHSVVTVHANCCRYINAKLKDLTIVLMEWKRLKTSKSVGAPMLKWSHHVNCVHSWKV